MTSAMTSGCLDADFGLTARDLVRKVNSFNVAVDGRTNSPSLKITPDSNHETPQHPYSCFDDGPGGIC